MQEPNLAAILFDLQTDVDDLLLAFINRQISRGFRLAGVMQTRCMPAGECLCSEMDLTSIGSRRVFRISQPLGQGARGCRLDPGRLAECSRFLEKEIQDNCDLLVLNRFGKGESEGRGFRDLIAHSLSSNVPVLTAVRPPYVEDWLAFSGAGGLLLKPEADKIESWFRDQRLLQPA